VEAVGTLDLVTTAAEVALAFVLLAALWRSRRRSQPPRERISLT
jgi:MYXO-CTERM domain-containing protein